jgi:streptogramin lyase
MFITCMESTPSTRHVGHLNTILDGTLAVLFALLLLPAAHAQIKATFDNASVLSTGSIPLTGPEGVAVDGAGDVYIANGWSVVKVTAAGAASVLNVGTPGGMALGTLTSVAVDGTGNLYITDSGNARVVEVTAAGVASVLNVGTPGGKPLTDPEGVAVDAQSLSWEFRSNS